MRASVIKLRLRRMGAKKQPSYRIVAAESTKPRDGRFIEIVGHYDPKTDPYTLNVNEERARYWLDNGAQPTETVRSLLVKSGVLPGYQGPAAEAEPEPATKSKTTSKKSSSADDESTAAKTDSEEKPTAKSKAAAKASKDDADVEEAAAETDAESTAAKTDSEEKPAAKSKAAAKASKDDADEEEAATGADAEAEEETEAKSDS